MTRNVAVIGLGSMGSAIATALRAAGWHVSGYDTSTDARVAAETSDFQVVDRLEDLAGTPFVLLSLPSARAVELTVAILLESPSLQVIIDTTTSEPATSAILARKAHLHGVAFVDAPVSGGRAGALAGALTAFVGANDTDFVKAKPVLDAITGGNYRHLGSPGAGNVVKLLNNALAAVNLVSVGDAVTVARAYGVDAEMALEMRSGASGGSKASETMFPRWVLSGSYDSGFPLGLMARDVALAVDLAAQNGVETQLLAAASQRWQEALSQLGPAADFSEISRLVAATAKSEG